MPEKESGLDPDPGTGILADLMEEEGIVADQRHLRNHITQETHDLLEEIDILLPEEVREETEIQEDRDGMTTEGEEITGVPLTGCKKSIPLHLANQETEGNRTRGEGQGVNPGKRTVIPLDPTNNLPLVILGLIPLLLQENLHIVLVEEPMRGGEALLPPSKGTLIEQIPQDLLVTLMLQLLLP